MSDEFGTVNAKRGERSREIEVIRQQYRRHRTALEEMIADAPTEHLAAEYQRLLDEIDRALAKLDELDRRPIAAAAAAAPAASEPLQSHGDPLRMKTEPGMRPLTGMGEPDLPMAEAERDGASRAALMIAIGIAALLLIGWLIWRASSDRPPEEPPVTETVVSETVAPDTVAPEPALTVSPQAHDYGVIRKGTRATRQFEIHNNTDEPISIGLERSECRCLYYEHADVVPPKGSETVTVTVDGARAKAGPLQETLVVTAKNNPQIRAELNVTASVR
jgi:hypothetical protein